MNKTKTYYQPGIYSDDGTNISWDTPEEINSFEAFASKEDCITFMDDCGYDDYIINEYHDDDIEGVTILDKDGNIVEINDDMYFLDMDKETYIEEKIKPFEGAMKNAIRELLEDCWNAASKSKSKEI